MAEVVLIRWPEDRSEGARLAAEGVAVLYLVGADDEPPTPTTCIEDWVRLPGDDRDLNARVGALEMRSAAHDAPPRMDDQGLLHYRGRLLRLQTTEARLAGVLIERFGDVATDRELTEATAGGSDGASTLSLRTQMAHLRSHLREVGLSLHRIRRRGYQLQHR